MVCYVALLACRWAGWCVVAKRKPAAASEQALAYAVVGLLWTCAATAHIIPFSFWRVYPCCLPRCVAVRCLAVFGQPESAVHTPARLFFHENNGFLCGFVFASVLLLVCAPLLLPVATVLLWRGSCEDNMRRNTLFRSY